MFLIPNWAVEIASLVTSLKDFREFKDSQTRKNAVSTFVQLYILLGNVEKSLTELINFLKELDKLPNLDVVSMYAGDVSNAITSFLHTLYKSKKPLKAMQIYDPKLSDSIMSRAAEDIHIDFLTYYFLNPDPRTDAHYTTGKEFADKLMPLLDDVTQLREPLRQFITTHFTVDEVIGIDLEKVFYQYA